MSDPHGRLGPYSLTGLLGRGGMGAVYRARHVELGVERAVKILTGRPSGNRVQRFLRETQVLARVQHPNVVRIHEAGQDPQTGCLYYAMDLVVGEPLNDVLRRGRLSWDVAIETSIALCEGVEALHELGVVHRDLKPPNVVLGPDGPVVLDLGLARDVDQDSDERLTRTGALVGTPLYMAPEQESGSSITPAADVYALGLIVLELLSGYSRVSSGPHAPPPLPSRVDPSLPRALDGVLSRALAAKPDARYRRAGELARALRGVRDRPGVSQRAFQVAVAAAVVAAALGALAGAAALGPGAEEAADEVTAAPSPTRDPAPGRVALAEAQALTDPERRYAALGAWLKAHPDHPDVIEAEAQRALDRRAFPLQRLHRERGPWSGAARFLAAGQVVGVGSRGKARRWGLERGDAVETWELGLGSVRASAFAVRGRRFAWVGAGRLWVVESDRETPAAVRLAPPVSAAVCWLGPDRVAVASGRPMTVRVYRLAGGALSQARTVGRVEGRATALGASDDARSLVIATAVETVDRLGRAEFSLWDLSSGRRVRSQPVINQSTCVRFLPNSQRFLIANVGGRIAAFGLEKRDPLWELSAPDAPKRKLDQIHFAHTGPVHDLSIAGDVLVSGGASADGRAGEWRVWSIPGRRPLAPPRPHPEPVLAVSLAPDAQSVVLTSRRGVERWLLPK